MTTFLTALGDLIGLTETHETEYDGDTYTTPSLIDHDDGKETPAPHGNHAHPITQA